MFSAGSTHAAAVRERLRLGFIGVGNYGRENLTRFASQEVAALCDVDRRYLEQARADYPAARTYRDFRQMIAEGRLDGVVISSPDHTHAAAAMLAIEAGLHVYCEKPLAHTVEECQQLARAASLASVAAQTGVQHHSSSGYRTATVWLQSGLLGEVREVHAWTDRPLWPQGAHVQRQPLPTPDYLDWDLWLGPAPSRPYHSHCHPIDWRGWWDFGAGAIGDMGPHLLDPVVEGLHLQSPSSIVAESDVVAEGDVVAESEGPSEEGPPQSCLLRYEFPERIAETDRRLPGLTLWWWDGGRKPPQEITSARQPPANGVIVVGERARMFLPERGAAPRLLPGVGGERVPRPAPYEGPETDHRQQWLAACRGEDKCSADFTYGARLTELCLLGAVAIRAGEKIDWDADRRRITAPESANRFLSQPKRAGW